MKTAKLLPLILALMAPAAMADEVHETCTPGADGGYDGPLRVNMNTTTLNGEIIHTGNTLIQEFQNNNVGSATSQKIATFIPMENSYVMEFREFRDFADREKLASVMATTPTRHFIYEFNRVTRKLTLAVKSKDESSFKAFEYQCTKSE